MNLGGDWADDTPEINLIPLIDVLFCLILFLVLTTSFNQRNAMKLQLPQAQAETVPDCRHAADHRHRCRRPLLRRQQ